MPNRNAPFGVTHTVSGHRRISWLACLAAALMALTVGAGIARAQSGGIAPAPADTSGDSGGDYAYVPFGSRDLSYGMAGEDVKTLNWLLKARVDYDEGVPLAGEFQNPTEGTVRNLQSAAGLKSDGVVSQKTRKILASGMKPMMATWYGPGFWGQRTACGKVLAPTTIGVANKKLPCGTKVTFAYKGHYVRAKVIDRGPYNGPYKWDLTQKLAKKLGFMATGAGAVRAAVIPAAGAKK